MKRKNATRSALFMSVISMLLCVSMLVGTTFAWFTDTAASGLNQIIAGNLDVALLDEAGNSVEGNTELFTMPKLWEPGAVAYAQIQVANVGTLDLKASLSINYEDVNSIDGHVLSEVLKYAIIDASNVDLSSREAVLKAAKASGNKGALNIYDFKIELEAGETSALQTLVIYWEPQGDAVDNLYNVNNGKTTSNGQPLQINLGVKVFATQLGGNNENEHDSFGSDYDENAPTIITVGNDSTVYATIGEAYAATNSTSFNVSGPIDMTKLGDLFKTANQNVTFNQIKDSATAYYDFSSKLPINVNGASITINGGYIQGMRSNSGDGFGFQHTTGTITYNNVTINDSWTNEHGATVAYNNCVFTGTYYVWTYSVPSITFNTCIFDKEDSRAILVYSHGNVPVAATITNCQFYADAKGYTGAPAWTAAVEVDTTNISSTGTTVAISGCSADQNYNGIVRDKSAVGKANATITVDGEPVINSQAAFAAAIAARKTNIYLTAGNYTMVNTNYDVTISGTSDAILTLPKGVTGNGNTITFDGITVVGITTVNNEGKADWYTTQLNGATKAIYQNCTIKGLITGYCDSDFINCVFENNFPDEYSVYCYSGSTYNFTDCTFNTACSKAIKVYDEGSSKENGRTVNVTNCKFVASASDKAAVEIDSTYGKYIVNINECEINEYYSKLWNDKGTNSVVTVDGVTAVATAEALSNLLTADEQNISVMLAGDIAVPMSSLGQQTGGSGEYKLGGDSTESIVIDLNGHKLTLTTTYRTGIGAKNADATITIKNGSMNGTGNHANTWDAWDLYFANCDYVFENVTFDKEVALTNTGKTATMKNVTINGTGNYYALWISAKGQNVEIDGLTINSIGRGIKIDDQYTNADVAKVTLKVSNATFDTAEKAAIMVKSTEGADIVLANVDLSGVAADTINAVWVDEDAASHADKVTVVGGIKIVEP